MPRSRAADAHLLVLAPTAAACRLARGHLDSAAAAHARLRADADPEALHDLRVALRRLRSLLRAYRPWLKDAIPRSLRRRLKRLARATNEARDAEVQLGWLRQQRLRVSARERAGLEWLQSVLAAGSDRAYRDVREELAREFLRVASSVRQALAPGARSGRRSDEDYAQATGRLIEEHAGALRTALAGIGSAADQAQIHAARIAAKRLRYLIEPVAPRLAGGPARLKALKRFQDEFGLLNDGFVRARLLSDAAQTAAAERARRMLERELGVAAPAARPAADPLPGLRRLARAVRAETRRRYARIRRGYLGAAAERFVTDMLRIATQLARARASMQ